jgi:hypothetical protein
VTSGRGMRQRGYQTVEPEMLSALKYGGAVG